MIITETQHYIYPPRSQDQIPRSETSIFGTLQWVAQYKYNDTRILIKMCPDGQVQLWNRHAERLRTYTPPDYLVEQIKNVADRLGHEPGKLTLLDGGLLDQKHQQIKDTIVIWDMLVLNSEHLLGTTYSERYEKIYSISSLETWDYQHRSHDDVPFGQRLSEDIFMPNNITAEHWDQAWDTINQVNQPFTIHSPDHPDYQIKPVLEGLVFKDPSGVLEMGYRAKNNDSWMIRSRVKTGRHNF